MAKNNFVAEVTFNEIRPVYVIFQNKIISSKCSPKYAASKLVPGPFVFAKN